MNSKRILGGILAVAIAGGIAVLANAVTTNDPSAADPKPSTSITTASDLVLEPGAAGPIEVGMSKDEALGSGLLVPGATSVEGCPAPALAWDAPFADALDVQALPDGEVASVGVRAPGPATEDGLGVGSSYGDVRRAYAGAAAVAAGYGQSGVLVEEDGRWIGFLFDTAPGEITSDTAVSFIELTEGEAPSLMRDGC